MLKKKMMVATVIIVIPAIDEYMYKPHVSLCKAEENYFIFVKNI